MGDRTGPRSRWPLFAAVVGILLLGALCLAYLRYIAPALRAETDVERAIKRIAATGAPVKVTQLATPPVPDAENAALVYEKAFAAMQFTQDDRGFASELSRGVLTLADPAVEARAASILKQNAQALQLVHRAAAMPKCDFRLDWSEGAALQFPQFGKLRNCAWLLGLESMMRLREGRVDDALAICGDIFRVARAADEPILIGALVQYAIITISSRGVWQVLRDSEPSVSACRNLAKYVASVDARSALMSALEGERAMAISVFDQVRAAPDPIEAMSDLLSRDYGKTGRAPEVRRRRWLVRSWLALDELTFLQLMDRAIEEAPLPYRKVMNIHPSLQETIDKLPNMPPRLLTLLIFPAYTRAQAARDRAIANLGLVEIALLLKAYRGEHGSYPESLAQLRGVNGRPLPSDPFSGKPFAYRREGAGFLIYSWGPNLKDNGGKVAESHNEGDMVLRCER